MKNCSRISSLENGNGVYTLIKAYLFHDLYFVHVVEVPITLNHKSLIYKYMNPFSSLSSVLIHLYMYITTSYNLCSICVRSMTKFKLIPLCALTYIRTCLVQWTLGLELRVGIPIQHMSTWNQLQEDGNKIYIHPFGGWASFFVDTNHKFIRSIWSNIKILDPKGTVAAWSNNKSWSYYNNLSLETGKLTARDFRTQQLIHSHG